MTPVKQGIAAPAEEQPTRCPPPLQVLHAFQTASVQSTVYASQSNAEQQATSSTLSGTAELYV